MINDKNFLAGDDNKLNDSMIDIVELPPDTVDGLLDHEELDDNNMDNEVPPGVKDMRKSIMLQEKKNLMS